MNKSVLFSLENVKCSQLHWVNKVECDSRLDYMNQVNRLGPRVKTRITNCKKVKDPRKGVVCPMLAGDDPDAR